MSAALGGPKFKRKETLKKIARSCEDLALLFFSSTIEV